MLLLNLLIWINNKNAMKKIGCIVGFVICLMLPYNVYSQSIQALSITNKEYFVDTISYKLVDSLPDGQYMIYRDSLKQNLFFKGSLVNGVMEETWTWYYEAGVIQKEVQYLSGVEHGAYTTFYPNGQKNLSMVFNMGVKDGLITKWYSSGIKSMEGFTSKNTPIGTWSKWDENGVLSSTTNYSE